MMRRIHTLGLVLLSILAGCTAPVTESGSGSGPLLIEKQGSFAAGGKVLTAPGTF